MSGRAPWRNSEKGAYPPAVFEIIEKHRRCAAIGELEAFEYAITDAGNVKWRCKDTENRAFAVISLGRCLLCP